MKILIVGGGGFIGKNMAFYLANQNYEISILGRLNKDDFNGLDIGLFNDDLSELSKYYHLINNSDIVIWLAHSLVPGIKLSTLTTDFDRNILPLVQLYENLTEKSTLKKFIYISSGGAVYGEPLVNMPIKEDHPLNPISQYGFSKKTAEGYLTFLSREKKMETIILRPSNIYGPLQSLIKPQGIIGFAIDAAVNRKTLNFYNEGNQIRDFLNIRDFCKAVFIIIENTKVNYTNTIVYNIGSSQAASIKDVVNIIENNSGIEIEKIHLPSREIDTMYNVLDCDKFISQFDWHAEVSLLEGIKSLMK
jgi:UDP-glucose 4-epimerase